MARLAVCCPRTSLKSTIELLRLAQQRVAVGLHGHDAVARVHEVDHVEQRPHGVDVHAADHGGFSGIGFGDDHARNLASAGLNGDGQRAANAAHAAIERKFSDEQTVGDLLLGQPAVGADDAQRHGQVEARTFLLDVGGSEIDCDVGRRNVVAAILQRRAHAVAALADRGIGQADGVEVVLIAS